MPLFLDHRLKIIVIPNGAEVAAFASPARVDNDIAGSHHVAVAALVRIEVHLHHENNELYQDNRQLCVEHWNVATIDTYPNFSGWVLGDVINTVSGGQQSVGGQQSGTTLGPAWNIQQNYCLLAILLCK